MPNDIGYKRNIMEPDTRYLMLNGNGYDINKNQNQKHHETTCPITVYLSATYPHIRATAYPHNRMPYRQSNTDRPVENTEKKTKKNNEGMIS